MLIQKNSLDMQKDVDKQTLCVAMAKYYIKIENVFAAILSTIDPNIVCYDTYTDQEINFSIKNKDTRKLKQCETDTTGRWINLGLKRGDYAHVD